MRSSTRGGAQDKYDGGGSLENSPISDNIVKIIIIISGARDYILYNNNNMKNILY